MSRRVKRKGVMVRQLTALVISTILFLSCGFYGRMETGIATLAADTVWSETEPRFNFYLSRYLKNNMGYTLKQNLMQHVVCEKMEDYVGLIG